MDVLHRLYRSLICLTAYLKVTMAPLQFDSGILP